MKGLLQKHELQSARLNGSKTLREGTRPDNAQDNMALLRSYVRSLASMAWHFARAKFLCNPGGSWKCNCRFPEGCLTLNAVDKANFATVQTYGRSRSQLKRLCYPATKTIWLPHQGACQIQHLSELNQGRL